VNEYRSLGNTLPLVLNIVGGERSTLLPGRLSNGKETQYPLNRRLEWLQSRYGRLWKIFLQLPGYESRTAQLLASRYIGYILFGSFNLISVYQSLL